LQCGDVSQYERAAVEAHALEQRERVHRVPVALELCERETATVPFSSIDADPRPENVKAAVHEVLAKGVFGRFGRDIAHVESAAHRIGKRNHPLGERPDSLVLRLSGVRLSASSNLRAYVGGLGQGVSETELRDALTAVGADVSHIDMVVNPATGGKRGFAFVVLALATPATAMAVTAALELVRTATICGRPITAQPIPEALTRGPV
jgi:hypothetical protein